MPYRPVPLVPGRRYGVSVEVDGAFQHHGPIRFVGWEGTVVVFEGPTGQVRVEEEDLVRVDLVR